MRQDHRETLSPHPSLQTPFRDSFHESAPSLPELPFPLDLHPPQHISDQYPVFALNEDSHSNYFPPHVHSPYSHLGLTPNRCISDPRYLSPLPFSTRHLNRRCFGNSKEDLDPELEFTPPQPIQAKIPPTLPFPIDELRSQFLLHESFPAPELDQDFEKQTIASAHHTPAHHLTNSGKSTPSTSAKSRRTSKTTQRKQLPTEDMDPLELHSLMRSRTHQFGGSHLSSVSPIGKPIGQPEQHVNDLTTASSVNAFHGRHSLLSAGLKSPFQHCEAPLLCASLSSQSLIGIQPFPPVQPGKQSACHHQALMPTTPLLMPDQPQLLNLRTERTRKGRRIQRTHARLVDHTTPMMHSLPQRPPPELDSKPITPPQDCSMEEADDDGDELQGPNLLKKGLKRLAKIAFDFVVQQRKTNFKEVAKKIISNFFSKLNKDVGWAASPRCEQNIKRRIYDALNVLIALGVFEKRGNCIFGTKEGKQKGWVSREETLREQLKHLQAGILKAGSTLDQKKALLHQLKQTRQALKFAAERNRSIEQRTSSGLHASKGPAANSQAQPSRLEPSDDLLLPRSALPQNSSNIGVPLIKMLPVPANSCSKGQSNGSPPGHSPPLPSGSQPTPVQCSDQRLYFPLIGVSSEARSNRAPKDKPTMRCQKHTPEEFELEIPASSNLQTFGDLSFLLALHRLHHPPDPHAT